MRKVASIQHEGGFTAICGMVIVDGSAYVLASKKADGKRPCMLYKIRLSDGKQKNILINSGNGLGVHPNSIAYKDHLFYIVTRNGAGKNYNQVIAVNSSGEVEQKYKYDHAKSKIATIAYADSGMWYITVNGGKKVKCREVELKGGWIRDKWEITLNYPTDDIGNDIFANSRYIYGTKVYQDMLGGYIGIFRRNGYTEKYRLIKSPDGYTKFEVEGFFISGGEYIVVNGVKNGKQTDGIWEV